MKGSLDVVLSDAGKFGFDPDLTIGLAYVDARSRQRRVPRQVRNLPEQPLDESPRIRDRSQGRSIAVQERND